MRYWTYTGFSKHPTLDFDIHIWETLSEKEILDQYWDYWCERMCSIGKDPEVMSFQNCINDWCIVHWAERNYWREMKDCIA